MLGTAPWLTTSADEDPWSLLVDDDELAKFIDHSRGSVTLSTEVGTWKEVADDDAFVPDTDWELFIPTVWFASRIVPTKRMIK